MTGRLIRSAAMFALFVGAAPMLAADAPLVDPPMRAGLYSITVGDIQIGGNLPEAARPALESLIRDKRTLCYDPRRPRGERRPGLIEDYAGTSCKPERASVDGKLLAGRLACENDISYGFTSYQGTFDQDVVDVELSMDMSFKKNDMRLLLTSQMKFEWQGASCQ